MVGNIGKLRALFLGLALMVALLSMAAPLVLAAPQEGAQAEKAVDVGGGIRAAGLALGAGIALAGGALGTGRVQAAVGASGIGVLAEKRDMFPLVLTILVIPETLVIFGFVLAVMMLGYL